MIKGVVFDRDGTLINYIPYLSKVGDVVLYPGVIEACHQLKDAGIQLFIATNQSGIGRGLYSEQDYLVVANYIERLFESNGITIQKTYYCPHHPEHGQGKYRQESNDRKPNPGMLLNIMADFDLAPDEIIMVGDSVVDIEAAKNAGIRSALVRTGLGLDAHHSISPDYIGEDVSDVVNNYILML